MKKLLNPIAYFEEKPLLSIGIISVIINLALGKVFGFKMLSIGKFVNSTGSLSSIILTAVVAYGMAIVFFYSLAYLINNRARWIDIINTIFIATIPMIIATLITQIPYFKKSLIKILEVSPMEIGSDLLTPVLLMSFLSLPFIIYSIILLYKGFKTTTHLRLWWEIALFILVYILASLLPQLLNLNLF